MKKVQLSLAMGLVTALLSGCSAPSTWVKSDQSTYEAPELNTALTECQFKERIKKSNSVLVQASRAAQTLAKPANASVANKKYWRAAENGRVDAYNMHKNASTQLSESAYHCMESFNFIRS
ncbi:MAG: hypothetical protein ACPGSN_11375 [Psychrobium sp.]